MSRIKIVLATALAFVATGAAVHAAPPAPAPRAAAVAPSPALPAALKALAIKTRSDAHGKIAGAQIGSSSYYVVYMQTQNGCGSGGCRGQIWKKDGKGFKQTGTLTVSYLPIMLLPQIDNGMPRLGLSVRAPGGSTGIMPVMFNGKTYGNEWNPALMPDRIGKPLVTKAMLQAF